MTSSMLVPLHGNDPCPSGLLRMVSEVALLTNSMPVLFMMNVTVCLATGVGSVGAYLGIRDDTIIE